MLSKKSLLLAVVAFAPYNLCYAGEGAVGRFGSYNLAVGQEIRYEVRYGSWLDRSDGKPEIPRDKDGLPECDSHEMRLFVIARNADDSFRVVVETTSVADYPLVFRADLFPNGEVIHEASSMPIYPEDTVQFLFPRLAADEREWKEGWQAFEPRTGVRWRYDAAGEEIHATVEGPLDRVGLGKMQIAYQLNLKAHLPASVELNGYWQRYKETVYHLVRFKAVVEHDENWASDFDADTSRYFNFICEQRRRLGQSDCVPIAKAAQVEGGAETLLDDARAAIIQVRDSVKEPLYQKHLDGELKKFDKQRESRLESARRFARLAGRPSPDWAAVDLDGQEHRLTQYRGKVLVLDFWFRQCNYCIRAMPQVEQATEHFRAAKAPVAFCGVSTDDDVADARFVAKELALKYPVLCSKEVAERYGVRGFPTFLVINGDGIVQGILSGYSSTLREDLITCVESMLPEQPAKQ